MKDYSNFRNYIRNDMVQYSGNIQFKENLKQEGLDLKIINSNFEEKNEKIIVRKYSTEHKLSDEERQLIFSKDIDLKVGYYVVFEDEYYIIYTHIDKDNRFFNTCAMEICNQTFKWQDYYGIHEFPCYCKNDSYGVSTSSSSDLLSKSEAKLKIYLQFNEETARVKKNTRLIFNSRETDIYKIIDVSTVTEKGLLIMICENDVYRSQSDNLIDNLADNSDLYNKQDVDIPNENPKPNEGEEDKPTSTEDDNYKIIGQNKIKHKNSYTYTLSPINDTCIWELDEDSVDLEIAEIIEQSNSSCVIYANEIMTNETIILYAKDKINNEILAQKEIIITKK